MVCSIGRMYAKVEDYAQENYYTKGEGLENAQWFGKGAIKLALDNKVLPEDYSNAHRGRDSEGNTLRQQQSGKKTNPGRDVTLSAPKSVSLLALVKGDEQAVAAHKAAVLKTMAYLEQNCIYTRTGKGGAQRHQTDNALIAIFHHDDNRNQDPQLHSHCIVFNHTMGPDGKWRSMDNRELYQQKMTLGAVYHHELGRELQALGYELTWNQDGTFEVGGYTQQQLQDFSTRRGEIIAAVGDQASAAQKAKACTTTRRGKVYQTAGDRQALKDTWQQRAEAVGIRHPEPKRHLKPTYHQPDRTGRATELLKEAMAVTSDRQVAFPCHVLLREVLRQSQGGYSLEALEQAINSSHRLIKTNDGRLTTLEAVERERDLLRYAQSRRDCTPLAEVKAVQEQTQQFGLNPAQENALLHLATSRDALMLCQGDAGAGKTYTMKALRETVGANCSMRGLAPSAAAAAVLQEETSIPSQTLDSYLQAPLPSLPTRELVVVDEAGMVSSTQMQKLLERLHQTNSRAILIGDTKQLAAVQAGSPFRLLQEQAHLPTARIDLNVRQQNLKLKKVVDLLATGQVEAGYQHLREQGCIRQMPIDSKRLQAVANDYLSRDEVTQAQTLILVGTNAEKQAITAQVRQGLINQGQLGQESQEITVLKPKDLNSFSLTQASSYEVGDVIRFRHTSARFDKALYYRVDAVDAQAQTLTLRDRYGSRQTLDLKRYKDREVFQTQTRELRTGEQMKFTRNQRQHDQINGQSFTVVGFYNGQVEIQTKGKGVAIAPDLLLHSDYRYADTVHSSQGKTANCCLYAAGSARSLTVGRESFYVAASRAKHEFTVYTASAVDLGVAIQQSRTKENALPLVTDSTLTRRFSASSREQEFKLLVSAKYLVEQLGTSSTNQRERVYQSSDSTEIRQTQDFLTITHQGSELKFDSNNATVRNTFSPSQIDSQITARTTEMEQHACIKQTQSKEWSISR